MFAADGVSTEYTFIESSSILKNQLTKAFMSYVDSFGVQKPNNNVAEPKTKDNEKVGNEAVTEQKSDFEVLTQSSVNKVVDLYSEEDYYFDLFSGGNLSCITTSFSALATAAGSSDNKISKGELMSLLGTLSANEQSINYNNEISFVKKLIARFDNLSNGQDYITSFVGVHDAQDYETVTVEQVTVPVDVSV